MNTAYHIQLLHEALQERFSAAALAAITTANLGQDGLQGQLGHPEFHYDDSAFAQSDAYAQKQRDAIHAALAAAQPLSAWQAFGRLSHALQDFYAHSNYVRLWTALHPAARPEEIDPLDPALLHSPDLVSGHFYSPIEFIYFIPLIGPHLKPLFPRDSHAWMNLDSPRSGPHFAFAISAARQRTAHELQSLLLALDISAQKLFLDR